jgi:hypothetical protein
MSETKKADEGSINQRQAAAADQAARRAVEPIAAGEGDATLRLRALELANEQGESPEATVIRAEQYYQFLINDKEATRG